MILTLGRKKALMQALSASLVSTQLSAARAQSSLLVAAFDPTGRHQMTHAALMHCKVVASAKSWK